MGEAAPIPKASARKKKGDFASSTTLPTLTPTTTVESAPSLSATTKGKQPSRATTPTKPTDIQRTEAEQLKIVLKRSRQETQISQQRGSGTDEGTGSKPGVPDVPSDDSEEELSWKSSDDEEVGSHEEGKKSGESDDDRPKAAEESKEERNDEEEQDLSLSEEARIQEEEDADELYRDNLPTFNSSFRFEERLRSLETSFSKYRQTNPFADAITAISGIVYQYMTHQMKEAVREA
nr:hypothetical protein [Tanacetum cinerariifolium]